MRNNFLLGTLIAVSLIACSTVNAFLERRKPKLDSYKDIKTEYKTLWRNKSGIILQEYGLQRLIDRFNELLQALNKIETKDPKIQEKIQQLREEMVFATGKLQNMRANRTATKAWDAVLELEPR